MDHGNHLTSPTTRKVSRKRPQVKNEIVDWLKAIIAGVVLVNKLIYDFRDPKPSEVVVFRVRKEGRDFIKVVIGVAGDTI
ncbi:S26 family signal peptidase [Paenibacillus terrae]|uniref:S26 family signal peptidase n=1 Tax=Paenibacillus terrae TaxID=159743 RepID=UPI001484CC83